MQIRRPATAYARQQQQTLQQNSLVQYSLGPQSQQPVLEITREQQEAWRQAQEEQRSSQHWANVVADMERETGLQACFRSSLSIVQASCCAILPSEHKVQVVAAVAARKGGGRYASKVAAYAERVPASFAAKHLQRKHKEIAKQVRPGSRGLPGCWRACALNCAA